MSNCYKVIFILFLCLTGRSILAQVKVDNIYFLSDNILLANSGFSSWSHPYSGSAWHDTIDYSKEFLIPSSISTIQDTVRYSTTYTSGGETTTFSVSIYLDVGNKIVDSFFYYESNSVTDLQQPGYGSTSKDVIKVFGVPFEYSSSRDSLYFFVSGEALRNFDCYYSTEYDSRSRFSHGEGKADTIVGYSDSTSIKLILKGEFPFSAKDDERSDLIHMNTADGFVSVEQSSLNSDFGCYDLLGKRHVLLEIGQINEQRIYSLKYLKSGCYFFILLGKTYKYILP